MQYVVHTSGEVLNRREKAYVIKAPSKEKAREIAKEDVYKRQDLTSNHQITIVMFSRYFHISALDRVCVSRGNFSDGRKGVDIFTGAV